MVEQSLVSVIMPCYNGVKFIGEAIESVINQTYKNWELIIVDDGSTDNSKKVIDHYLSDTRINYIRHIRNKGIPIARNTGINSSCGEFIALLDQDDKWLPNKLALQLDKFDMSKPEIGLVFGNIVIINSKGQVINENKKLNIEINQLERKDIIKHLFVCNFIPSITVMFKKECINKIGQFDESIIWGGDDYELWLRLTNEYNIAYLNMVLAMKRQHSNNYSNPDKTAYGEIALANKIIKKYSFLKYYYHKKIASSFYRAGRSEQIECNFFKAKKYYLKSILSYPFYSWKPYICYLFALLGIKK